MRGRSISTHALVLLAVTGIVVGLTTLPASVVFISLLKQFSLISGHPNASDAVGHAGLYGTLTAVIYWALRGQIGFSRAFWVALLVGLGTGLLTELVQHFSPGRTTQLSDLLGNWLGVMTAIALIGFWHSWAQERLQQAV